MKKSAFILLIATFVTFRLEGHVELTYPEGGETFHPGDAVNVTWIEVVRHEPLNWDLYFSVNGGATWDTLKADIPTEELSYRWTVPVTQTRKCRIKIVQDNEMDDYEWISSNFTIASATGTSDPLHSLDMKIYPNPLIENTVIAFENPMNASFTLNIYDTRGRIVRSITNITSGIAQVDRGNLSDGLYFILLRDEDEIRAMGKLAVE